MIKRVIKLIAITAVALIATITMASAATIENPPGHFQAYDYTQQYYASGWKVPLVNYTGYVVATATGAGVYLCDVPSDTWLSGGLWGTPHCYPAVNLKAMYAGQKMQVICWTNDPRDNHVVDKVALGIYNPSYNAAIWYVGDYAVNLTYADRINYVPHCAQAAKPARVGSSISSTTLHLHYTQK